MRKAVIIGAGPAGLTAAYELLTQTQDIEVVVFEESNDVGGISKTVNYKGNRMDVGGHRFFSKIPKVNEWWEMMLPLQGSPSMDDIRSSCPVTLSEGGPDPEQTDRVMLRRHRVSRILFESKFYDYPISLKRETFKNFGVLTTIKVGLSYICSVFFKHPEDNLENLYINSFGRKLYSMFFEYYTENLWGRHPKEIDASWGRQRTKGLSIWGIVKDYLGHIHNIKNCKVSNSFGEIFSYPKLGPGQLWEVTASEIEKLGGKIQKNSRVTKIHKNPENRLTGITYELSGRQYTEDADIVISSMPIKDLVAGMNDVPPKEAGIAAGLPYRDYIILGVLVPKLNLENKTVSKTINDIVPDCWIYVQDRKVNLGRIQIYNNWSPYMVKDIDNTVWIGLEYFVNEGDKYWNMTDEAFSEFAIDEMVKLNLITSPAEVLDTHVERMKKAYPAYFDTYNEIATLKEYLNSIENLYCVGRNGQHRYNNIDHSMMTSFEAVKCILSGNRSKDAIWNVNTENGYHEKDA